MIKTIFPVLTIGVAIALYFMFTDAKIDEIKLLQEEEAHFDTALAQTLELGRIHERLESQFNELQKENLDKLEKMLIKEIDPIRLVYDIDNIAVIHGKKIKEVGVEVVREKKGQQGDEQFETELNSISVSFVIDATYNELLDFIRDLEQSLQIVDIENVSFSTQKDFSGQSQLINRITLRAYTL